MYIYNENLNPKTTTNSLIVRTYYSEFEEKWRIAIAGFFTNECYSIGKIEKKEGINSNNIDVNVYVVNDVKSTDCKNIDDNLYFVYKTEEIDAPQNAKLNAKLIETTEIEESN